ncbi:MAG: LytS/YhcK type 5TM receptor domain-containing protein, partial [Pseudomonadota bacterium]
MSIEPDTILQFVNSLGLLALIALGCGAMARAALPPNAEAGGHIALFGGGAILAMLAGAGIEPGVRVDGSGIVIGLAGLFLAPVVAMAAAALAGVFRLFVLGGFGATADAVGIVLACGLGLAAAQALKARRTFDVRELLLAGLFIRLSLVSLFVLPFGIAVAALPQALLTLPFSAAAALVFGLLLQRERRLTGQARGLL